MAAKGIVRGDKEIRANMRRVRAAVGGRDLDIMMRESLKPLEDETRQNALQRRQVGYNPPGGHLDQGVVTAKYEDRSRFHKTFWVSFRRRARKIAHLVEFGTAPHWQPRRRVMHPGARPYPFFRPAFESTKSEVISKMGKAVWRRMTMALIGIYR